MNVAQVRAQQSWRTSWFVWAFCDNLRSISSVSDGENTSSELQCESLIGEKESSQMTEWWDSRDVFTSTDFTSTQVLATLAPNIFDLSSCLHLISFAHEPLSRSFNLPRNTLHFASVVRLHPPCKRPPFFHFPTNNLHIFFAIFTSHKRADTSLFSEITSISIQTLSSIDNGIRKKVHSPRRPSNTQRYSARYGQPRRLNRYRLD